MLLVCFCGCAVAGYFLVFLPNKRKAEGKESTQFVLQRVNVSHKTMSIWLQCTRCSVQWGGGGVTGKCRCLIVSRSDGYNRFNIERKLHK